MNGIMMTVSAAIQQSVYTTRSLGADEAAGYIQLVRAAEASLDDFDEPGSVRSPLHEHVFANNPINYFSDWALPPVIAFHFATSSVPMAGSAPKQLAQPAKPPHEW
jgi:hypothetical protein